MGPLDDCRKIPWGCRQEKYDQKKKRFPARLFIFPSSLHGFTKSLKYTIFPHHSPSPSPLSSQPVVRDSFLTCNSDAKVVTVLLADVADQINGMHKGIVNLGPVLLTAWGVASEGQDVLNTGLFGFL